MAKRQVVSYSYTCDVCGGTIPESDGEGATRKLSWEGSGYVVDVCSTHDSQLGEILAQLKGFVDAGHSGSGRRGRRAVAAATSAPAKASRGRRVATSESTPAAAPKRGDLGVIRAWARENGHTVNERGRIPAALLAAYDAAASALTEPVTPPAAAPAKRAARKASPTRKRAPRKAAAAAAE